MHKSKIGNKTNWWVSGRRASLAEERGHANAKRAKQQACCVLAAARSLA